MSHDDPPPPPPAADAAAISAVTVSLKLPPFWPADPELTEDPYTVLKAQLTKRTTDSEQCKLQQLFTSEELGERKPTQLLRRMQQLLGDRPGITEGSFLKELFLQRLPPNVRMVLASTPEGTTLDKLADLADKIMEVAAPSVATITTPPALTSEMEHLHDQVAQLSQLVQKLVRSRSSSRPSRRSSTPAPTNSSTASTTPPTASDSTLLVPPAVW